MKKLLFIVLMGMSALATAQTITFADSNFRNALVNTLCVDTNGDSFSEDDVDINNDGLIQLSEALAVQRLNLLGSGIFSLKEIENFTNLLWLDCSHNTLDTLDLHALTNLEYLDCTESQITTINIQGLSNLQKLECPDNFISILNVQGLTSLQEINCTTNYITSLDVHGFNALTKLYCTNNQITTLNIIGLSSILELNCSQNLLTSINVQGLTTLQALYCGWNPISSLNVQGLTNLQTLWCSGNPIGSLNVQGLTQLHRLYCDSTLISSLNLQGLNLLNILMCSNNNLSVLDLTGLANLEYLFCNNNHFTQLHFEGVPILQHLECNNNLLTTLNLQSLALLSGLYCSNNQLTMLNINNTYFETYLEFDNNPNLVYVCCDTNEINQVQAKINSYGYINCAIGSYCSFTPGGTFYSIQGKNRIDIDNNGCNTLDPYWPNLKLSINNGSTIGNLICDTSGNYNLPLQAGNYVIKPIFENLSYFLYDSLMVSLPTASSPFIYDFCIIPNGVHHDLEISIIPIIPARPGFDATYKIVYKNKGNKIESGYLTLGYSDSLIDFVNTSETPSAQAFGMLTWNFSNLMPMQTKEIMLTMNSNSPTENPALNVGDILSFDAVIVGGQPEETIADNSFGLMQTVVGSYDPNDKTCLEGNRITPSMVGNYIHYLIRFENTGTYAAENIVVKDIIDTTVFVANSLQVTDASHNAYTRITNGNQVEFIFENIQLPFDDANNDGYIAFKIKTKADLVVGDSIKNIANIYFDYNFPVETNEAQTTVQNPIVNIDELSSLLENLEIFPNPVLDILSIKSELIIEKIEIYVLSGRIIQTHKVNNNQVKISDLPTGTYFVKLHTRDKIYFSKLVKK